MALPLLVSVLAVSGYPRRLLLRHHPGVLWHPSLLLPFNCGPWTFPGQVLPVLEWLDSGDPQGGRGQGKALTGQGATSRNPIFSQVSVQATCATLTVMSVDLGA